MYKRQAPSCWERREYPVFVIGPKFTWTIGTHGRSKQVAIFEGIIQTREKRLQLIDDRKTTWAVGGQRQFLT